MPLIELQSYTDRKKVEGIATLASGLAPIPLPTTIQATQADYSKTWPPNLPFFWLSLADPTPQQQQKFNHYLKYLYHGRGESEPKCLQVKHEAHILYLVPPSALEKQTKIKCCYMPDPNYTPPSVAMQEVVLAAEDTAGTVHPRFLKTQSHIHAEWILGGFAELIHNSNDAESTKLLIDVELKGKLYLLRFIDNGTGMSRQSLVRMLCFGHEDECQGDRIGKFGVGFKTGSMRIASDAIVFTRTKTTQSVGLLSQSSNTGKKVLTVPIVSWKRNSTQYDMPSHTEAQILQSLDYIYQFSPFNTLDELHKQFNKIDQHGSHVVLFNLNMAELDFVTDPNDVRVASPGSGELFIKRRYDITNALTCAVITKKTHQEPGNRLHTFNGLSLLMGFNQSDKDKGLGGFMMYWHGVLIKAYNRIGIMVHNSDAGNGVIGIVECNNLEPLNNKQAFNEATAEFRDTEKWLERCLREYWYEKINTKDKEDTDVDPTLKPENVWAFCDKCHKWRLLPPGTGNLPKYWFCWMNSDQKYNSCSVPQQDTTEHKTVAIDNLGEPKDSKESVHKLLALLPSTTKSSTLSHKPNLNTNKSTSNGTKLHNNNTSTKNTHDTSKSNLSQQSTKLKPKKATLPPKAPHSSSPPLPTSQTKSSSTTASSTTASSTITSSTTTAATNKKKLLLLAESNIEQIDKLISNLQDSNKGGGGSKRSKPTIEDSMDVEPISKKRRNKIIID